MAEAFLNRIAASRFVAQSAGLEPGTLNPLVVEVMAEEGYDLSGNQAKDVFEMYRRGEMFSYVITVCDGASAERCPLFPGITKRLHWSFADPSALSGSHAEQLAATRVIRDEIQAAVAEFIIAHA
jgi:arsenate reductase